LIGLKKGKKRFAVAGADIHPRLIGDECPNCGYNNHDQFEDKFFEEEDLG
jgi:hypothetical protein